MLVKTPGYCDAHRKARTKAYNDERRDRNDPIDALYKTARWRAARAKQLRLEPLCRLCKPVLTPAVLVDHIKPVRQGGDFWDPSNHQSLCNPCHERKSHAEGSRFVPR